MNSPARCPTPGALWPAVCMRPRTGAVLPLGACQGGRARKQIPPAPNYGAPPPCSAHSQFCTNQATVLSHCGALTGMDESSTVCFATADVMMVVS